jgi:hypothetical protein
MRTGENINGTESKKKKYGRVCKEKKETKADRK